MDNVKIHFQIFIMVLNRPEAVIPDEDQVSSFRKLPVRVIPKSGVN